MEIKTNQSIVYAKEGLNQLMNWKTNEDDIVVVPIKGGGLTRLAWFSG